MGIKDIFTLPALLNSVIFSWYSRKHLEREQDGAAGPTLAIWVLFSSCSKNLLVTKKNCNLQWKGAFLLTQLYGCFGSTYIGRCTDSLGDWLSEWEQQKDKIQFNSTTCPASWCCDITSVLVGVAWGAGIVQLILTDQHRLLRKFPNQRARVGAGLNYLFEQRGTARYNQIHVQVQAEFVFFRCPTTTWVSLAHGQSRSIINKAEGVCP